MSLLLFLQGFEKRITGKRIRKKMGLFDAYQ